MKIWYLEITSWRGTFAVGAKHYYGRLRSGLDEDRAEIDLERELSAGEVRQLNREEGWALYAVGDKTKAFNSEEDVIEAAKQFAGNEGCVIIRGNWCVAGPQEVLVGPVSLSAVFAEWKGWEDPNANALCEKWEHELKVFTNG